MDKATIARRMQAAQTAAAKAASEVLQRETLAILEEMGNAAIEQVKAATADRLTIKRLIRDEQGRALAVVPELLPLIATEGEDPELATIRDGIAEPPA
jgi:hypothetical protein